MKAVVLTSLFLAFVSVEGQPCQPFAQRSFEGCDCNILGVCDISGTRLPEVKERVPGQGTNPTLIGYAPSGIEQFGYVTGGGNNLAYLCEGGTVAILYDCNARIPLYAATMITGAQLNMPGKVKRPRFQPSQKLDKHFQQNYNDYKGCDDRNVCYESRGPAGYFVETDWYGAIESKQKQPLNSPRPIPCISSHDTPFEAPMSRGHLIAKQYVKQTISTVKATFTYTNIVPQFGKFNSGEWRKAEEYVVGWAKRECTQNGQRDARIYIVVGAIPSTHIGSSVGSSASGSSASRFFGKSGFSDYQGKSVLQDTYGLKTGGEEYRVNVPDYMWTAVCCTSQDGNDVRSGAFYRRNDPGNRAVVWEYPQFLNGADIFPKNEACKKNFDPDFGLMRSPNNR